MKKLLLTGSKGYIGENFIRLFNKKFSIVKIDKKINKWVEELDDFENVDYIVHLAAISGIVDCQEDPDKTFIDNVSATLHLMKASWVFNIPMIFASSQCAKDPISSLYASTKRIGEVEAMRYNKKYGDIKILRFSNIYGGKNYLKKKNSAVAKFIRALKKREKITVDGNGEQQRDFVHVDEICKTIVNSLDVKISEPIDIGTGIPRTINDLASLMTTKDNIKYDAARNVGNESSIANTSKFFGLTNFQLSDKLEEYIGSELKYIKEK